MTMTTDKKGAVHRPAAKQPVAPTKTFSGEVAVAPTPSAADVPDFKPRKRDEEDTPPINEKYDDMSRRKETEASLLVIVEGRLSEMEQLGLDAGRWAQKVKTLRRNLRQSEKSLATYRKNLIDAEAVLAERLNQLNRGAV